MYTSLQQKEAAYRERITHLHAELEAATRELNTVTSARDVAKSEVGNLTKQKESLTEQVRALQAELELLDKTLAAKTGFYVDVVSGHNESSGKQEKKIETLLARIEALKTDVALLVAQKKTFEDLRDNILLAAADLKALEQKKNEVFILKSQAEVGIKVRESALVTREQALDIKKKLVDERAVENEMARARLEVYVKRLQQFYDESNINLSILDTFGVKRDNI